MDRARGRQLALTALAGLLVTAGPALSLAGWRLSSSRPPEPPSAGVRATAPADRAAARADPAAPHLPFSTPVQLIIPAIGVNARIVPLGENPDGTVRVPPLSRPSETSWFDLGPAPGELGPAVLYGHVDTAATGPAVFYKLGDLRPGDLVQVVRADHLIAVFRVDTLAMYAKSAFPTSLVYGPTPVPRLRLVTCGGPFNPATGHYLDNTIVFASLVAVRAALAPISRAAGQADQDGHRGRAGGRARRSPGL